MGRLGAHGCSGRGGWPLPPLLPLLLKICRRWPMLCPLLSQRLEGVEEGMEHGEAGPCHTAGRKHWDQETAARSHYPPPAHARRQLPRLRHRLDRGNEGGGVIHSTPHLGAGGGDERPAFNEGRGKGGMGEEGGGCLQG